MPKSQKHKKARQADFTKAKLKLGKGKQVAQNATSTSFTAKSIALPNQHLAEQKSEPVSKRNLTTSELLVQARHYNQNVRKDALSQLRQLVEQHPELVERHQIGLVNASCHLIADESRSIRQSAIELVQFLFDSMPKQAMETATTTLTLYILAALTSIDEETRISALEALDLLIESFPERVCPPTTATASDPESTPNKILDALLSLLKLKSASASSSDLSPKLRKAVLNTMHNFLKAQLSELEDRPWYMAPSFRTSYDFDSFLAMCTPAADAVETAWDKLTSFETYPLMSQASTSQLTLDDLEFRMPFQAKADERSLLATLHSTLQSTFLDSAPSAFGSQPSDATHIETITAVLRLAIQLYRSELAHSRSDSNQSGQAHKLLVQFLARVYPYFPFDVQDTKVGVELGLIFAELVSLLVLSTTPALAAARAAKGKGKSASPSIKGDALAEKMVQDVTEWLVRFMRGELSSSELPLGIVVTEDTYAQLEPTLWTLLNRAPSTASEDDSVWTVLLDHFDKAAPKSAVKKRSFAFLSRCVLTSLSAAFEGSFAPGSGLARTRTSKWVATSLPKTLWQLDDKDQALTSWILHFLSLVTRAAGPKSSALDSEDDGTLSKTFATFFSTTVPSSRKTVAGPYVRCSAQVQKRARELAQVVGGAALERIQQTA